MSAYFESRTANTSGWRGLTKSCDFSGGTWDRYWRCRTKWQWRHNSGFFKSLHDLFSGRSSQVKNMAEGKGFFQPWTVNCRLCYYPETIYHYFIFCTHAFLFWDVLQGTLQKELFLNPSRNSFFPVSSGSRVPYDHFLLLGLHSLWRCRMVDRNTKAPCTTISIFIQIPGQVKNVYQQIGPPPDWFLVWFLLAIAWSNASWSRLATWYACYNYVVNALSDQFSMKKKTGWPSGKTSA